MSSSDFDEPQFLEPAHHHDPTKVAYIAGIPAALLENLPADAQKALWDIQESTSVVYASWRRLEELSKERFHRLVPAKKQNHEETIQCRSDPKSRTPIVDISHRSLALHLHQSQYADTLADSEPAFQNYINSLQAEKAYFLEEAVVDFRHKALRIDFAEQHDKKLHFHGKNTTPVKWWARLQGTVETW
jgi:hypothetical protein